jgi:hypothetical protein
MAKAVACLVLAAVLSACSGPEVEVPSTIRRSALTGTWSMVTQPFPGGPPGTVALMTDGRVLVESGTSTAWYALAPDGNGSYQNGTWAAVASTTVGRLFHPSFVLRDGRFWTGGGELISDPTKQAGSEIFDPATNTWTAAPDMPQIISDTAGALLADGRVFILAHACFSGEFCYSELLSSYGVTPSWSPAAPWDLKNGDSEMSSLLLPDGSVLCGSFQFQRYLPASDSWVDAAPLPGGRSSLSLPGGDDEFGPTLLLHDGTALVLGANDHNAIYTPPPATDPTGPGSWLEIANTPSGYNHADSSSTVEPDGRVLTVATLDQMGSGQGAGVFYEYDPPTDTWTPIDSPFPITHTNGTLLLVLPNGQIWASSGDSNNAWLYTPAGVPQTAWRPTITSVTGPSASGEFTLSGAQLNGLTTGADFGDDNKMATNYPIVWLTDGAGHVTFGRTHDFDQMAPRPGTAGSAQLRLPNSLLDGAYTLHVAANGVESANTLPFTMPGPRAISMTGVSGALPNHTVLMRVNLSGPAPAGGMVVNLSSTNEAVATPFSPTATALEGRTFANFNVQVHGYGKTTLQAATAAYPGFVATKDFGWSVTGLSGTTIPNATVGAATWTVTLDNPAPDAPVVVTMGNTNTGAGTVDPTISVPAGASSQTFDVWAACPVNGLTTITASLLGSSQSHTFGYTVQSVSGPAAPTGGASAATWTVTLDGNAPPCGVQVSLQSSDASVATVPATVTVPWRASSATFDVTVVNPAGGPVTITASLVGSTTSSTFTGYTITGHTMSPSTLPIGSNATGTVTLNGDAPAGGIVVNLIQFLPAHAIVPATVTVPQGASSATYQITATAVNFGRIRARLGGSGTPFADAFFTVTAP